MNDLLNFLFSERFEAKEYVKIYYSRELFALLMRNEQESRAFSKHAGILPQVS